MPPRKKERERQTDRQADRPDRQTDGKTHGQTDTGSQADRETTQKTHGHADTRTRTPARLETRGDTQRLARETQRQRRADNDIPTEHRQDSPSHPIQ